MRNIFVALACAASVGETSRSKFSEGSSREDAEQLPAVRALATLLWSASLAPAISHHKSFSVPSEFADRRQSKPSALRMSDLIESAAVAEIEGNPMFVDEDDMIKKRAFTIPPDKLVHLAKRFLVSGGGVGGDPELLSEDFKFVAPVVGPLSKEVFLKAIGSVDIKKGFPDFDPQFHNFQVDPFEGNRVWYIARGRGTNIGALPPFVLEASGTGKSVVNPPQACSLSFNEKGLITKYTIGYVIDREVGNTGGLGGIYGILQAIGRPLPFPEAQPWQMSPQYKLFQMFGELVSIAGKR